MNKRQVKKGTNKFSTDYKKQVSRIKQEIKRIEKRGYTVEYELPKQPKRITQASVNKLKKINSTDIYKKSKFYDKSNDKFVTGNEAKQLAREFVKANKNTVKPVTHNSVTRSKKVDVDSFVKKNTNKKQKESNNNKQKSNKTGNKKKNKQTTNKVKVKQLKENQDFNVSEYIENRQAEHLEQLKQNNNFPSFTTMVISNYREHLTHFNPKTKEIVENWLDRCISSNGEDDVAQMLQQASEDNMLLTYENAYDETKLAQYLTQMVNYLPDADELFKEQITQAMEEDFYYWIEPQ